MTRRPGGPASGADETRPTVSAEQRRVSDDGPGAGADGHLADRMTTSLRARRRRPSAFEWTIALVIVVTAGGVVAYLSRGMWFYSDVWDFMALRRISDVESILRPHFGHWQVPAAVQTRLLYAIGGVDFWPVHQIARAIVWGAFSLFAWWVMRRRGAEPVVAMSVLAIISVLGTSYYFQATHVGALIAIACVTGAAILIERRRRPSYADLLALFGLLLIGVMSTGIAVAALPALLLAVPLLRRSLLWLLPVVASAAVYAIWFLAFDVSATAATGAVRSTSEIPWGLVVNLRNLFINLTGLPEIAGGPLLLAAVGGLGYLLGRRRLPLAGVIALMCALSYLALVTRSRMNLGRVAVATNVTLLLVTTFVPLVRLPRRWIRALFVAAAVAFVAVNAVRLNTGLDSRVEATRQGKPVVESMAALIAASEPYWGSLQVRDLTSSSQLTVEGLATLVDDGWDPPRRAGIEEAALRLRVSRESTAAPDGAAAIALELGRLRSDGCAIAFDGSPVSFEIAGFAGITVRVAPATDVIAEWSGSGTAGLGNLGEFTFDDSELFVFGPPPGATVTLRPGPDTSRIVVCGLGDATDAT